MLGKGSLARHVLIDVSPLTMCTPLFPRLPPRTSTYGKFLFFF